MATIVNDRDLKLHGAANRLATSALALTSSSGTLTKLADGSGYSPSSFTITATVTGMTSPLITFYYSPTGSEGTYTQISTSTGTAVATAVISSATYLTQKGSGAVVHYKATASQTGILSSVGTMFVPYSEIGNTGPTGAQGPTGPAGTSGPAGAMTYRVYYLASSSASPPSTPANTTSGGTPAGWSATPYTGLTGTQAQFQSDGSQPSGSTTTTWSTPYLSYFRVGSLSAITASMGSLTVDGAINTSSSGYIYGGSMSSYASGSGYFLGYSGGAYKFSIGDSNNFLRWDGSNMQATLKGMYVQSIAWGAAAYAALGWDGALPPIYGYNSSSTAGAFYGSGGSATLGTNTGRGVDAYGSNYGVYATGSTGVYGSGNPGVRGDASSSSSGVQGVGSGTGHGVRGQYGGRSGLVGCASFDYDFYAEGSGVNYGPFTGTHDVLFNLAEIISMGDIIVDAELVYKKNLSNTIARGARSSSANQKGAVGVLANVPKLLASTYVPAVFQEEDREDDGTPIPCAFYSTIKYSYKIAAMNSLGEGQINVCGENGDIEIGDLIVSSSIPGKGMKQADDIIRSYTVAKARENITFTSPAEVKQIGCIYLCG